MLFRLIAIWICNLIDTIATVYLYVNYDGTEINPICAELLKNPPLFTIVKVAIMSIAVLFLLWKKDWILCKIASWILFIEYLLIAIYYICVYMMII
jgi:hypothetical protein